jgi:hypothetical protein
MNKKIRVFLFGGLGNQLFIFFAGQSLARINKKEVVFDSTEMNYGITKHGSNIESFDFGYSVRIEQGRFEKLNHYFLVILRRLARSAFLKKLLRILPGIHFSPSVGFDQDISKETNLRLIYGYFQSWKHLMGSGQFQESRIILPPSIKSPTDWFISKVIEAEASRPIMIHLRLGDYLELAESFGILSGNYFRSALIEARKSHEQNPLWVFSNDLDTAKKILKNINGESFQYIVPPNDSNDAESMLLMSKGVAVILSNSTFSWWSAAFSKPDTSVYYPSKWFKTLEDPKDLIPSDWTPIKSDWFELEI